jgi:hypothetical protein
VTPEEAYEFYRDPAHLAPAGPGLRWSRWSRTPRVQWIYAGCPQPQTFTISSGHASLVREAGA